MTMFRRVSLAPQATSRAHTDVHQAIARYFEWAQDVIAALLTAIVLVVMVQGLWTLARVALIEGRDPRVVLPQIVLLLILVELFRTLLYYLREHRVAVGLMIEVAIVGLLRELLVNPPGTRASDAIGVAVLLLALGVLLVVERVTGTRDAETPSRVQNDAAQEVNRCPS